MTTDTATSQAQGIVNLAAGDTTGAAAVVDITLGFKPRFVQVFNETDAILWQKYASQSDANTLKSDTAVAKDTGSAIVLKGDDGDTYKGFAMSATLAANAKVLHWVAYG